MASWPSVLANARDRGDLSPERYQLAMGYMRDYNAKKKPKQSSLVTTARNLVALLKFFPEDFTTESCIHAAGQIGERYKVNSQHHRIALLKRFARYLAKKGYPIDLDEIGDIELPALEWKTKQPEDLLKREEVKALIDACGSIRDKTLIAMLYDGSHRPGELAQLNWGDITFDVHGACYTSTFKTGFERHIRLTDISLPYLLRWKENYPLPITPSAPVFINDFPYRGVRGRMTASSITNLFKKLKKIDKRLKPSIFRSSRITADVEDGYNLTYVSMKNWGTPASKMIRNYANPDQGWMDREALVKAGMDYTRGDTDRVNRTEQNADLWKPIKCPSCGRIWPAGTDFCAVADCMTPLTPEAVATVEGMKQDVATSIEARMEHLENQIRELREQRDK